MSASPVLMLNWSTTGSYDFLFMLPANSDSAVGMAEQEVHLLWNCGKFQPGAVSANTAGIAGVWCVKLWIWPQHADMGDKKEKSGRARQETIDWVFSFCGWICQDCTKPGNLCLDEDCWNTAGNKLPIVRGENRVLKALEQQAQKCLYLCESNWNKIMALSQEIVPAYLCVLVCI